MVVFDLFLVYLAVLAAAIIWFIAGRLAHFPSRGIIDVPEFLRPVNPGRMRELMNPDFENGMRLNLPPREFLRQQRKSLHYVLEFLLCTSHDAYILIEFADNELWRETVDRPGAVGSQEFIARASRLHQAAVEFRVYALFAIVKVRFWMIFRTQWWLPLAPPHIPDLREIQGIRFHASFNKLLQAVSDLGILYGREFQEALLNSLVKSDPLAP